MPTYNLGTITVSSRVAQLLKSFYEEKNLPPEETATGAQVLSWIREDVRSRLVQRMRAGKQLQREKAAETEDAVLDGEVSVA